MREVHLSQKFEPDTRPNYALILFGILGILVMGLAGIRSLRRQGERVRVLATTQALSAEAIVERKDAYPLGKKGMAPPTSYSLTFRVKDQIDTLHTDDVVKWEQTESGSSVTVTYHQSENGEIVVEDWQPKRNVSHR